MLFWAIKQQVEKGPQDSVTYESRYSLSEEKLIRQTVDFHALTVYVSSFVETSAGSTETPVRVFDCDTITQVKEKCLDAIFKTTPYSRRPSPQEVDLEWRTGVSGRLILTDFNATTKVEPGNWRKINTLGHYKVPNNASLALIPKQISVYNMSLLSERSDKSSTFSLKNVVGGGGAATNSPTLNGVRGGNNNNNNSKDYGYGTKDSQEMANYNKVYHLIKPTHDPYSSPQENAYNLERSLHNGGAKMMSEIYLTRLLTTKGTLQKFVEDLFEAIFTTTYRGSVLPVCVNLPLRFWVNIIKNPHFVFDIARPLKIEGCLSVVAQTLMDSCSTQDPQLTKDSPSSKLLFARDIHTYRGWVEEYYKDIQELPIIADQDMSAYLNDESHCHMGEFNIASALYELYNNYVKIYGGEQLLTALENDESSRKNRLPAKYTQLLQLMDGQTTSTTGHLVQQYDEFHSNRSSSHVPSAGCYTYGDVSLPR
uniref:Uncharacterized protein n=1 Tax=Romanomermis culicivorax TaxID=13658 RepID=A0A915HNN0_ROMCU